MRASPRTSRVMRRLTPGSVAERVHHPKGAAAAGNGRSVSVSGGDTRLGLDRHDGEPTSRDGETADRLPERADRALRQQNQAIVHAEPDFDTLAQLARQRFDLVRPCQARVPRFCLVCQFATADLLPMLQPSPAQLARQRRQQARMSRRLHQAAVVTRDAASLGPTARAVSRRRRAGRG